MQTAVIGSSAALVAGCGGPLTYSVRGTQRDPGADGRIQVENIEGGNHLVTITITNMTPPDRLGSGNTTYLVWFRAPNGVTTLASQLAYETDSRTGRATATTPHGRFTVMVTAEVNGSATAPSEHIVLQQQVSL